MIRRWRWGLMLFLLVLGLTAGPATAETIEMVTYYPAPSTPDLHTRSLTVGTPYATVTPDDGQAFIYDSLGIGPGFTAGDPPSQRLEVVGNVLANAGGTALFMASRGDNVSYYNGLQLLTNGVPQWTVGSRNNSTEDLHIFSDVDNATRLFIQQGTGRVGIGTTNPSNLVEIYQGTSNSAALSIRKDDAVAGRTRLVWSQTGNYGFIDYDSTVASGVRISAQGPLRLGSNTNAAYGASTFTEVMRVASSGNVGIGTTNPTSANSPAGGPTPNTGNLDANDVWLRGANRWASEPVNTGTVFVYDPATRYGPFLVHAGAATWFPVNVSGWVPANTRAIICYVVSSPAASNETLSMDTRVDASSFGQSRLAQWSGAGSTGVQVVFPIAPNRTFQCRVGADRGGSLWLYLVGYYAQ